MALTQLSILLLSTLFLVQLVEPASSALWPKVQYGDTEDGVVIILPKIFKPFDLKEIFAETKEDFEQKIAKFFEDDEKKMKIFGKLFKLDEKLLDKKLAKEDKVLAKEDKQILCNNNYKTELDTYEPCAYEERKYELPKLYDEKPLPKVYEEQQVKAYYVESQENLPCCEDGCYS